MSFVAGLADAIRVGLLTAMPPPAIQATAEASLTCRSSGVPIPEMSLTVVLLPSFDRAS
jgi:hypothetical protein